MSEGNRGGAAVKWAQSLGWRAASFREDNDRQAIAQASSCAVEEAGGVIIGDVVGADEHRSDKRISPEGFFDDAIGLGEDGDEDHDVEQGRMVGDDDQGSFGWWGHRVLDEQDAAEAEAAEEETEFQGDQVAHPESADFGIAAAEENQGQEDEDIDHDATSVGEGDAGDDETLPKTEQAFHWGELSRAAAKAAAGQGVPRQLVAGGSGSPVSRWRSIARP